MASLPQLEDLRLPRGLERVAGGLLGLLGFSPMPVPPHVFSLDQEALRFGSLPRRDGELELREYRAVEVPEKAFQDGVLGGPLQEVGVFSQSLEELLGELSERPSEASLVIPDDWLRVLFSEIGELPRGSAERQDVIRWKLRRQVPFRVEDLRVRGSQVEPLADQEEPNRILVSFAIELLLTQLEEVFRGAGVRLGQVSNQSFSLLSAFRHLLAEEELAVLTAVVGGGYTLVFTHRGEPVLHRYKTLPPTLPPEARSRLVRRDLGLTVSFLERHFPGSGVDAAFLLGTEADLELWRPLLAEGLAVEPRVLGWADLPLAGEPFGDLLLVAPMLGAAAQEVT